MFVGFVCVVCFGIYLLMQAMNPHVGKGCAMLIVVMFLAIPVMFVGSLVLSVLIPFLFSTLPYVAFLVAICWIVKRATRKTCP